MRRGLAVHVFKNPQPSTAPSFYSTSKGQSDPEWTNENARPQFEGKLSSSPTDPLRTSQPAVYVDTKRSKSSRGRAPYPYSSIDTYIFDAAFPAAPDALTASPSSSSSDSDIFSESAISASIEISSTLASSSTETLETALVVPHLAPRDRPPYARAGSSSDWSRITPDGARMLPPGLHPISRNPSTRANAPFSNPGLWLPYGDAGSDTDDETYVEDELIMLPPREDSRYPRRGGPLPAPAPTRRYSDERPMVQEPPAQRLNSGGACYRC